MNSIHKGKIVHYKNGSYRELDEVSYIFTCQKCEYRWTGLTEEAIKTTRNIHNATVHPEDHIPVMFEDAHEALNKHYEELAENTYVPIPVGD